MGDNEVEDEEEEIEDGLGMSRMKSLLESYYGVGDGLEQKQQQKVKQAKDLNSGWFDPDVYVKDLITNQNLVGLLKKDEELLGEVRKLDADMQLLVYENYSKFVNATDIIRSMRENVEGMETQITSLVAKMENISQISGGINTRMSEKRGKIEKLSHVQKLVKKLNFLVQLPPRLRESIELGALKEAVGYYVRAAPFLAKYTHVPSFAAINRESRDIIKDVRKMLTTQINDSSIKPIEFNTAVYLLLQLEEPKVILIQRFLQWHTDYFTRIIQRIQKEEKNSLLELFIESLNGSCLDLLVHTTKTFEELFLAESEEGVNNNSNNYTSEMELDLGINNNNNKNNNSDQLKRRTSVSRSKGNSEADLVEIAEARKSLSEFTKSMLNLYLTTLRARFASEKSPFSLQDEDFSAETVEEIDLQNEKFLASLKQVMQDLQEVSFSKGIIRSTFLADRGFELAEHALRYQVDAAFGELRHSTEIRLLNLYDIASVSSDRSGSERSIMAAVEAAKNQIVSDIDVVMRYLKRLLMSSSSLLSEVSGMFDNLQKFQLKHWFIWFANALECQCDPYHPSRSKADGANAGVSITSSTDAYLGKGIDLSTKKKDMPQLVRRVSVSMKTVSPNSAYLLSLVFLCNQMEAYLGSSTNIHLKNAAETPELVDQLRRSSARVLRGYVDLNASGINLFIQESFLRPQPEHWLNMLPPTEARDVIVTFLERISDVIVQLQACGITAAKMLNPSRINDPHTGGIMTMIGESSSAPAGSSSAAGGVGYTRQQYTRPSVAGARRGVLSGTTNNEDSLVGGKDSIRLDIDRMFSKRIDFFGKVNLNYESIIGAILRSTLKVFIECVRQISLGKFAFQQIQLDANLIRSTLPVFVEETNIPSKLLQELLSSARDRSFEYVPLDQSRLDELTSTKKSSIRLSIQG